MARIPVPVAKARSSSARPSSLLRPAGFTGYTTPGFRPSRVARILSRAFYLAASLKLAIPLLSVFALCLAMATFLESAYSGRVAQDLVYHTWWFTGLLGLLAVNVLCAALKKIPWKRHQTGFLITHAGLLVLVFGGLMTNLGGVEGQMMLLDSENDDMQQSFRLPNRSDTIQLVGKNQIEVIRVPLEQAQRDEQLIRDLFEVVQNGIEISDSLKEKLRGHHWALGISPGSFAWKADEYFTPELPWTVKALGKLARPFPGYSRQLGELASLKVENFYPHTESWPYAPAAVDEAGFPAIQLRLKTPMTPRPMKRWVTSVPEFDRDPSPVAFEMLVLNEPALLQEFLDPPHDLGKDGQLVIVAGPKRKLCRVPLDQVKANVPFELEGTPLKFTLRRRAHLMELLGNASDVDASADRPTFPAVQFELSGPEGTGTYIACARMTHLVAYQKGHDFGDVAAWYHYPDFRWGQTHRMGCLQFLYGPRGKLHYRVFGKDGLRDRGVAIDPADQETVYRLPWKPMDMQFEVLAWMPNAVRREHVKPRHVRPGAETAERFEPALRCTLECKGEKKEFWVRMSRAAKQVVVGKEMFFVRYRQDVMRLPFTLALKHAKQASDPGTNRPAAFESDVVLIHDRDGKQVKEEHRISMNNTLDHNGFKVYQTNYRPMTDPETGEMLLDDHGDLVSMSGFTIADDPGLLWKYVGSGLMVLGIAVMFWMRAYFFKPRVQSQNA